jgi:hypothetical protein
MTAPPTAQADGVHAFLRDETGEVISLCNDGNVYCNITTFNWVELAPGESVIKCWYSSERAK